MKKTIEEGLKYNNGALEAVWKQLPGTNFPADPRSTLVLAYVSIALEHHHAISTLVKANLKGSALALMRSQLESFMRGMWAATLATDQQVTAISQQGDEPFPKF